MTSSDRQNQTGQTVSADVQPRSRQIEGIQEIFEIPGAFVDDPSHLGPPRPAKVVLGDTSEDHDSKQEALQVHVDDVLDDKKRLQKSLSEAEQQVKDAERRLAIAGEKISRMEVAANKHVERARELQESEAILVAENQQQDVTIKNLIEKEAEAQEGVLYLKQENLLWMKKANQYEADLKQTQEKSIREMTEGRWNPIPDKDIRDRLYVLNQDVRDWSRSWATTTFKLENIPDELRKDFVRSFLVEFVQPDASGRLPTAIGSPSAKMKDKLPWLLLSSALSCEIEREYFTSPFFCAGAKHEKALEDTYAQLIKANPREAHIWRSTMWRIMNPPGANWTAKEKAVSLETQHRVLCLCDRVDAKFKKGPAKWLLRNDESDSAKKERAKALRDILMKAAGIATSLFVQRPYLECVGIDTFIARKVEFHVESTIMQSHALNRVDPEDHENNGRRILFVVRPAILAFDEDDTKGLDGGDFRVLAPAIVFLAD